MDGIGSGASNKGPGRILSELVLGESSGLWATLSFWCAVSPLESGLCGGRNRILLKVKKRGVVFFFFFL